VCKRAGNISMSINIYDIFIRIFSSTNLIFIVIYSHNTCEPDIPTSLKNISSSFIVHRLQLRFKNFSIRFMLKYTKGEQERALIAIL